MEKVRFVGFDVHKDTICIAVAEGNGSEPEVLSTIPHDIPRLVKRLRELGRGTRLRCVYEAGPTGFGLSRALAQAGIDCTVVTPSQVPDVKGGRVKTDKRDAVRLARFLRSGDLVPIHVPSEDTEAMRDLSRARSDAGALRVKVGQQLGSFLLRHGRRYEGRAWTKKHLTWVEAQVGTFKREEQRRVLADYLAGYRAAVAREAKLVGDIEVLAPQWPLFPVVQALMALRGVSLITGVTVVSEIGDFSRFSTAPRFASYLGVTASEHSSGNTRRQGGITLAGNRHVRRVLVEAAWHYRFASPGAAAAQRAKQTTPEVRVVAQKAQERLSRRFYALNARGKPKNKIVVAVARELACFMWAIANEPSVTAKLPEAGGKKAA